MPSRPFRLTALAALSLAMSLAAPRAVHAAGLSTSVTLSGGTLSFSTTPSASDFPTTTLTGNQQTIHASLGNWGVDDARGTGAGWHVTFQASQFSDGAGDTLPLGSLTLVAPVVIPGSLNVAVPPLLQGVTFVLDDGSAVPIVHALTGTGQGAWTMTQTNLLGGDLSLVIPPNAAAGTYTSNLTFTLATGP